MIQLPLNILQKKIYEILRDKQTTDVYDCVSSDATFPYIAFSDYEYEIDGSKTSAIFTITLEIEIWSDYAGKFVINGIAEDVIAVLTAWPVDLSVDGFNVLSKDVKSGAGRRQDELFYGVVRFVAKVQYIGI